MARLVTLSLLLLLHLSCSQMSRRSQQDINGFPDSEVLPPPQSNTRLRDLLGNQETRHITATQTYAYVNKDNAKLGIFVAASLGTITLMAVVYCIYNKFYTKHQYLHMQQHDDPELSLDSTEPGPMYLQGSLGSVGNVGEGCKPGYGSLLDTPSIISVPPCLSPPPFAMGFPPLRLSSHSLRTISAKDLEKSCL